MYFLICRSELGKSINTDEAAAMGAVYQAAYLGKGFKVKTFGVKEASIYPINVSVSFSHMNHVCPLYTSLFFNRCLMFFLFTLITKFHFMMKLNDGQNIGKISNYLK